MPLEIPQRMPRIAERIWFRKWNVSRFSLAADRHRGFHLVLSHLLSRCSICTCLNRHLWPLRHLLATRLNWVQLPWSSLPWSIIVFNIRSIDINPSDGLRHRAGNKEQAWPSSPLWCSSPGAYINSNLYYTLLTICKARRSN